MKNNPTNTSTIIKILDRELNGLTSIFLRYVIFVSLYTSNVMDGNQSHRSNYKTTQFVWQAEIHIDEIVATKA